MTSAFQNALRSLECSICTEVLSDPRILPCGHSLCGPKSPDECIVKLEHKGVIACPICRISHNVSAHDVPPAYGYGDMLAVIERVKIQKMCEKHSEELLFYCHKEEEEVCITCWQVNHMGSGHRVEPISVRKQQKLSACWEKIDFKRHLQFTVDRSEVLTEVVAELEKVVTGLKTELTQETKRSEAIELVLSREDELTENLQSENFSTNNALVAAFDELCTDLQEAQKNDRIGEAEAGLKTVTSKISTLKQTRRPSFGEEREPKDTAKAERSFIGEVEVPPRANREELTLSNFYRDLIQDASSSEDSGPSFGEERKPQVAAKAERSFMGEVKVPPRVNREERTLSNFYRDLIQDASSSEDSDATAEVSKNPETCRVKRSQTFTTQRPDITLSSVLNVKKFSTLRETGAYPTSSKPKPVINVWTSSTLLDQIEHQPSSPFCYPVFCPDNQWIFVLSKTNWLMKYSINTAWQSSFILENQEKLENKVSSMAMGPNGTIYISFDAGIIPSIHQFHCGKKFLRIAGDIRMTRPTNLFFNVKYLLSSVPKKSALFVLPASLHSPLNTAYIFRENFLIRRLDLPGNTLDSLFHDFGAKTGILVDFGEFDQSVLYKFEWCAILGSKSETVFRYFTNIPEVECRCITSFSVNDVTRQNITLGIRKSVKLTSHKSKRMIIKTFQSKKTKCATAELVGESEVRVPRGLQPLYFVSTKDGIVVARSIENDDAIFLIKML